MNKNIDYKKHSTQAAQIGFTLLFLDLVFVLIYSQFTDADAETLRLAVGVVLIASCVATIVVFMISVIYRYLANKSNSKRNTLIKEVHVVNFNIYVLIAAAINLLARFVDPENTGLVLSTLLMFPLALPPILLIAVLALNVISYSKISPSAQKFTLLTSIVAIVTSATIYITYFVN
ncbi:MAG: hypothetical protein EOO17_01270 [Chloroflexi bacterium]|nr:MAG: hypothetical protein EOO17_01270 [Chloroflexota bacterium]